MKILYIINDLNIGGAEIQLLKLLSNLSEDYEPTVIALGSLGTIGPKVEKLGVPVYALNNKRGLPDPRTFYKLVKLIKFCKPDVIHTWAYHSNLVGGISARIANVKQIIWSIHHNDLSTKLNKGFTIFVAKLGAYFSSLIPDRIVCVSEKVKNTHLDFGYCREKLLVIGNGIDTEEFKYDPGARKKISEELQIPINSRTIGFFARYDPLKNIDGFLRAISELKKDGSFNDLIVIMAGTQINSENLELSNYLNVLGIKSCVKLLGVRDDIPALMSSVDIVVNASFNESFSLVLAEAMACEVNCITTMGGDPSQILGNNGITIETGSVSEIKNAVKDIFNWSIEKRKTNGVNGRAKVESLFTIGNTTKLYESQYSDLGNRRD